MQIVFAVLLLLDSNSPETLDTLGLVRTRRVVVSLMRVDLSDPESEERHRKELEGVLERGAVSNRRQQGVLLAGLFICRRLQST